MKSNSDCQLYEMLCALESIYLTQVIIEEKMRLNFPRCSLWGDFSLPCFVFSATCTFLKRRLHGFYRKINYLSTKINRKPFYNGFQLNVVKPKLNQLLTNLTTQPIRCKTKTKVIPNYVRHSIENRSIRDCYHIKGGKILRSFSLHVGGEVVKALDSGSSGPGSSPGRGHCVVFLSKTLNSHSASLHPGV